MDEFGDHIVGCKLMLPLRTKLWHDPLVQMWHQLTKMSGQSCGSEVTNLMFNSNKRADVALYKGLYNVLTDGEELVLLVQARKVEEARLHVVEDEVHVLVVLALDYLCNRVCGGGGGTTQLSHRS